MLNSSSYWRVDETDSLENTEESKTTTLSRRLICTALLAGIAIGLALKFLILSPPNNCNCLEETSNWSPALQIYKDDNKLTAQRFNGALRTTNSFRGPPSQEIDNAWDAITLAPGVLVRLSREEVEKANVSEVEYAAKFTVEMGGGYMAGLEVFHELHCLNMLRKATNLAYYLERIEEWKDMDTLRYHLDHCIDMLRQKLMCDPDLGIVTYVWAKGWKQAFPNFSTNHKCRPYDKVLDWAREKYSHSGNMADIQRAPGAMERETRP